ncbi:MAG: hypothetical protein DI629_17445 [Mesorhizobium amorphae]|nr:MAG: hypothetical protein DI629_17445 [Mesorhizobium amorphae]
MSDDPETLRQIQALARDTRPLLVVDVDEVVLEFVSPFAGFLASRGHDLGQDVFRLHGNIFRSGTREALADEEVSVLIDEFWGVQADWQQLALGAESALANLSREAEVVLLTAMPHRFGEHRRRHLQAIGLPYPLLTTERDKGPAVAMLRGADARPVAFVDDILRNHLSVRDAVPDAGLFHIMAHAGMRAQLPALPADVVAMEDWRQGEPLIARALGIG